MRITIDQISKHLANVQQLSQGQTPELMLLGGFKSNPKDFAKELTDLTLKVTGFENLIAEGALSSGSLKGKQMIVVAERCGQDVTLRSVYTKQQAQAIQSSWDPKDPDVSWGLKKRVWCVMDTPSLPSRL